MMYKNLNPSVLGASGRQSELIELAMTYGFRGLDIDGADLLKRAVSLGVDEATRYTRSAKLKLGGWTLPMQLGVGEAAFGKEVERLTALAELAKRVGLTYCTCELDPASDESPYHENFERHREHLGKAGEVLGRSGMRLGVGLRAAPGHRQNRRHQFIHQAEELLTLLRTTGSAQVGLALDTWNWKLGGGGFDQLDDIGNTKVISVRLADLPLDMNRDEVNDTQRLLPSDETLEEHAGLLKRLAKLSYDGPVTIAPHPSQLAGMSRDAAVSRCSKLLDQLWALAGIPKAGR
jgi:sugar phosphate isomerase/epimerase